MILGVGNDIVQINRIEALLKRFGTRFEHHGFTQAERDGALRINPANTRQRASYFAKRFAAKEAFAKALGTGFRGGLRLSDIGVINDELGKPHLVLSGKAQHFLSGMAPNGRSAVAHLSLSDDYPIAQAIVIISAV